MEMKTSDKGIALIKKFEGFRKKAYLCPAGVWTIGYGHTDGVQRGDNITAEGAEALLREDLELAEFTVNTVARAARGLSQCQFDALVSFVYNVGRGNFHKSTLRRLVIANPDNLAIRGEFLKWNKGGGQVLEGLSRRREAEARMYFGEGRL